MKFLVEDLLDDIDLSSDDESSLIDKIQQNEEVDDLLYKHRLVFTYSFSLSIDNDIQEKTISNVFDMLVHSLQYCINFMKSYKIICKFEIKLDYKTKTENEFNLENPNKELYSSYFKKLMNTDIEGSKAEWLYKNDCGKPIQIKLYHWIDFVPEEKCSFKYFCHQFNNFIRMIYKNIPSFVNTVTLGIIRKGEFDLPYQFKNIQKNTIFFRQPQLSEMYVRIYPEFKNNVIMDLDYDEKYLPAFSCHKYETHFLRFLRFLDKKDKMNIFKNVYTYIRGDELDLKNGRYNIWLHIKDREKSGIPKDSEIYSTDRIIELAKEKILVHFDKESQEYLMNQIHIEDWNKFQNTFEVNFNICIPEFFLDNPHSTQFRYETEVDLKFNKKFKIYIKLYSDSKKWIMQESLVDENGEISPTGEGITYMSFGKIMDNWKNNR